MPILFLLLIWERLTFFLVRLPDYSGINEELTGSFWGFSSFQRSPPNHFNLLLNLCLRHCGKFMTVKVNNFHFRFHRKKTLFFSTYKLLNTQRGISMFFQMPPSTPPPSSFHCPRTPASPPPPPASSGKYTLPGSAADSPFRSAPGPSTPTAYT